MRALTLFLFAAVVHAQTVYEIRGTVVDLGGGPVPGATVTIGGIDKVNQTVTADAGGSFRAVVDGPGRYNATANKDGYFPDMRLGSMLFSLLSLDSAQPRATVTLTLAHAAEIVGRMLDDETRQPIAGARVYAMIRRWSRGRMVLERVVRNGSVTTDAEGNFRFTGLQPAMDYIVSPQGLPSPADLLIPNYSAEDVERTDELYAATYWPGGSTDPAMVPDPATASTGFVNIGTIYARKVRQYRAHVTLGACDGKIGRAHV